jgi:hypothetical protein
MENIYMIIVDGYVEDYYGYFNNFEDAKAVAKTVAEENGIVEETSWKSEKMFENDEHVIGVRCINHHLN